MPENPTSGSVLQTPSLTSLILTHTSASTASPCARDSVTQHSSVPTSPPERTTYIVSNTMDSNESTITEFQTTASSILTKLLLTRKDIGSTSSQPQEVTSKAGSVDCLGPALKTTIPVVSNSSLTSSTVTTTLSTAPVTIGLGAASTGARDVTSSTGVVTKAATTPGLVNTPLADKTEGNATSPTCLVATMTTVTTNAIVNLTSRTSLTTVTVSTNDITRNTMSHDSAAPVTDKTTDMTTNVKLLNDALSLVTSSINSDEINSTSPTTLGMTTLGTTSLKTISLGTTGLRTTSPGATVQRDTPPLTTSEISLPSTNNDSMNPSTLTVASTVTLATNDVRIGHTRPSLGPPILTEKSTVTMDTSSTGARPAPTVLNAVSSVPCVQIQPLTVQPEGVSTTAEPRQQINHQYHIYHPWFPRYKPIDGLSRNKYPFTNVKRHRGIEAAAKERKLLRLFRLWIDGQSNATNIEDMSDEDMYGQHNDLHNGLIIFSIIKYESLFINKSDYQK